jgi:hypothetical protein
MTRLLRFIAALVSWLRRSPAEREAEIVYPRQQLVVLKRTAPARPRLKATDRLIFLCLYRLFPSLLDASIIFRPETLLRWHRTGFRLFWRWKSRRRVGRPAVSADIRSLVRRISRENPLWGCAAHSWRAAQARHPDRRVDRGKVHGATTWPCACSKLRNGEEA